MPKNRTSQQMTLDIIRIAEILSQTQSDTDSCYKQDEESRRSSKETPDDPSPQTRPS